MSLSGEYFQGLTKGKARKRVGRGIASGTGKTAGSGHKGQKARSGVAIKGFEGGQTPIHIRLPKRGFHNIFRTEYAVINLGKLQELIDNKQIKAGSSVTKEDLAKLGIIKSPAKLIKLLAKGKLKDSLKIEIDKASKVAIEAVKKAGGEVITLSPKGSSKGSTKASVS
jgi:large subunit ribosomal protein L15